MTFFNDKSTYLEKKNMYMYETNLKKFKIVF